MGCGGPDTPGAKLGDKIRSVAPGGRPLSLTAAALFEAGLPRVDKSRVYVNLTTAQSVLRRPNVIGRIELRLRNPFESKMIAARLEALTGHDAESWEEANANFLQLFQMQGVIIRMVV